MGWLKANKLKLNSDKMEALWFGVSHVWELNRRLFLDGVILPLKEQVHSLEVLLDPSLPLEAHVSSVTWGSRSQLPLIHQL